MTRKGCDNMVKLIRNRPLSGESVGYDSPSNDSDVIIRELPFASMVNLRVNPKNSSKLKDALGFNLPTKANTTETSAEIKCLWLGPNEWLIISDQMEASDLCQDISHSLEGLHYSAKEVSDNYASISITGQKTLDVLSKLTPLDVHESSFGTGTCAQTVLAKSNVILERLDANTFTLIVRRSFASYVWKRLIDAGVEFKTGVHGAA